MGSNRTRFCSEPWRASAELGLHLPDLLASRASGLEDRGNRFCPSANVISLSFAPFDAHLLPMASMIAGRSDRYALLVNASPQSAGFIILGFPVPVDYTSRDARFA
jgi:hypothetical protein